MARRSPTPYKIEPTKEVTMDVLKAQFKAIAGAIVGALVSVLTTTVTDPDAAINPDAASGADQLVQLPNTQAEWVTFFVSIVVGWAVVYFAPRNQPTASVRP